MSGNPRLVLSDSVRIYSNGIDEIRIRKGIWNHEEAILSLEGLSKDLKGSLITLFAQLDDGQPLIAEAIPNQERLTPEELEQVTQIIEALQYQNYICAEDDPDAVPLLYEILGGTTTTRFLTRMTSAKPVLFFADTQSIKDYASHLAQELKMPLTVMTETEFKAITALDLTTKYDGYGTRQELDDLLKFLAPFGCVVGCIERPHIMFLRNLNRALVQTSQPMSLALLDGPFTTVFTIKPPETGCFECFELRLMARMQDMAVYQRFANYTQKLAGNANKTHASPLMHSLASQVLFEGFLISSIGKAKLAGRVLNTYLPIMEIQVQDLLRVPFCPACGFVSEARLDEMYTSTKKIVDKVVDRIVIKN